MPAYVCVRALGGKGEWAAAAAVLLLLGAAPIAARAAGAANPPKPAAAAPAAKPHEEPGKLQHLAPSAAASVLGRAVRGPGGHEVGRVIDVLVDQAGRPRAAVIDFGGFMGVGSRKIAVGWHLLHFTAGAIDKPITLELTPDQIKAAPEYRAGATPTIVAAPPAKPAAPETAAPAGPAKPKNPAPPPASAKPAAPPAETH